MSVVVFLVILGVIFAGTCVFCARKHKHDYDAWGPSALAAGIVAAALALSAGIVVVVHNMSVESERHRCEALADGRDSKFVQYNYFSRECLVKSTKGRYVPLNQVNKVELEVGG